MPARHAERPHLPLGLDLYMPIPDSNPWSGAKAALGRRLFRDSLLSRDGSLACASCHQPGRAFTDGRAVAVGVGGRKGTRSAPTLVNRAYGRAFFWDGRAASLEEQVLGPIQDSVEMDLPLDSAILRLERAPVYRAAFLATFGRRPNRPDLARALASYLRTVLSGDSRVDRYLHGEPGALSPLEREGLRLFQGKANCVACHVGPSFTDERFHNTGVAWLRGPPADSGRWRITRQEHDVGVFKTPTLREVGRTAPYMHDGSFPSLEAVIDFYDRGGEPNPYRDDELRPLGLSAAEKAALIAFLEALTGVVREDDQRLNRSRNDSPSMYGIT
jgi:cytochrome c peroxidase